MALTDAVPLSRHADWNRSPATSVEICEGRRSGPSAVSMLLTLPQWATVAFPWLYVESSRKRAAWSLAVGAVCPLSLIELPTSRMVVPGWKRAVGIWRKLLAFPFAVLVTLLRSRSRVGVAAKG